MNWEAIGAIGELVGAAAVVATLVYLAIQVRQNSASVQSAAAQSVLLLLNETLNVGASSSRNAHVVVIGQTDFESLEPDEKIQFALIMIGFFRTFYLAYQQYRGGLINESVWKGHYAQVQSLMGSESVRRVWEVRQNIFSDEFRQFISSIENSTSDAPRIIASLLNTSDAKE